MSTKAQTGATIKGRMQRAANASGSIPPSAPVNTVAPLVTGSGGVGQLLTCSTGSWSGYPAPVFTYQWQLNTVNISGATSNTYTPVSGDLGGSVRCVVTGTNGSGSVSANSNAITVVSLSPPVNTVAPAASPTGGTIGTVINCGNGTWTGAPTPTYAYQWQRNTIDISGATSASYSPAYPADNGVSIRCVVTATNSQGSASANSNAITIETYVAPTNTVAPAASPTGGLIGTNITTGNGTWTSNPAPTFTYQLQRNTVDVSGQTANNYTPVYPADSGASLRWRVTATNLVGSNSANSNAITIETYTLPANTVAPVVSGSGAIGSALSVSNGTWTGNPAPTFTRQWRRGGSNISGATGSTYTPAYPADNSAVIDCVVTATNAVGGVSQASSNSITVETYTAPAFTVTPAASPTGGIIGTAITCNNGTTTGNPAPTITKQWQRGGIDISGATGNSYTPVYPADNGASIRCVATATNVVSAVSSNSNSIAIETYVAPVNTVAPVVSGTGVTGSPISTTNGTWTGNPAPTFTYQALKNGTNISGATSSSYTPSAPDVGGNIGYRVTGTNVVGSSNAVSSNTITVTAGGGSASVYDNATAIFSVRKLRPSFSGNLMRVRRSSDNLEVDIGFDANGNLNEAALLAHVGAGTGFVRVWFDQSGNNRDVGQATAGNQPTIVTSGVVNRLNGRPTVFFNGTSGWLSGGFAPAITYSNGIVASAVFQRTGGVSRTIVELRRSTDGNPVHNFIYGTSGFMTQYRNDGGTLVQSAQTPAFDTVPHIGTVVWGIVGSPGSGGNTYVDRVVHTTSATSGARTFNITAIGTNGLSPGTLLMTGNISEVFISGDTVMSVADRQEIENNEAIYYEIGGASNTTIIMYGLLASYNISAFVDTSGYTDAEVLQLGNVLYDG